MTRVSDALQRFRLSPNLGQNDNILRSVSSVFPPAALGEVESTWNVGAISDDVVSLWRASRTARLFEDTEYGQWGLVLLDPQVSLQRTKAERAARPYDFRDDDIVIGEFLGDQDLLVVAPSEFGSRRVLVALPLDSRDDWFGAAEDLGEFLDSYFAARGSKYWERAAASS